MNLIPTLDINKFFKFGRLSEDERMSYYKSLKERAYIGKNNMIYIRTNTNINTESHSHSHFIEPIKSSGEQIVLRNMQTKWINYDSSNNFNDLYNGMGIDNSGPILTSNCTLKGYYYYIHCNRINKREGNLEIIFFNLFKPLCIQRIVLKDKNTVVIFESKK